MEAVLGQHGRRGGGSTAPGQAPRMGVAPRRGPGQPRNRRPGKESRPEARAVTTPQEILDALDGVSLVLDADLTVIALGRRNWRRYWCLNGERAEPQDPLGRDITSFFTEGVVRDTFRLLFQKVLWGEQGLVRLDYRCDARNLRRLMRLTLTPLGDEGSARRLLYQSVLLSEAPPPPHPL